MYATLLTTSFQPRQNACRGEELRGPLCEFACLIYVDRLVLTTGCDAPMLTAVSPEKFGAVRSLKIRPSPNVADLAEGGVVRHPDRAHQHSVSSFRIDETGIATVRRWHGEHDDCTARFSLFLIAAISVVLTHSSAHVTHCGNPLPALGRSCYSHRSVFAAHSDENTPRSCSQRAT